MPVMVAATTALVAAGTVAFAQDGALIPPRPNPGDVMKNWPAYPEELRQLGQEGTVMLKVTISAEGKPVAIGLDRSSGSVQFDAAAALAVSKWTFTPAQRNNAPVETTVTLPIKFSLPAEPPAPSPAQ